MSYQRRPCPKCGSASSVGHVQNDWNRMVPIRYREKNFVRRRIDCSNPKCNLKYWTLEVPELDYLNLLKELAEEEVNLDDTIVADIL